MNGFLRNIICQSAAGIANDQCWLLLLLLLKLLKLLLLLLLLKLLKLLLLLLLTTVAITITVAITTTTVVYYIATSITSLSARSCSAKPGRDPYLLGNRLREATIFLTRSLTRTNITSLLLLQILLILLLLLLLLLLLFSTFCQNNSENDFCAVKIKLRKTSNSIRPSTARLLLRLLRLLLLSPPLLLYIILLPLLLASLPVPVRQSPVGTHTCWGTAYERLLFFLLVVLLRLVLLLYDYYY